MLFYLTALAVAASVAIPLAIVILALLTFTPDERCRQIENGVKARLLRKFNRRADMGTPDLDRQHASSARHS